MEVVAVSPELSQSLDLGLQAPVFIVTVTSAAQSIAIFEPGDVMDVDAADGEDEAAAGGDRGEDVEGAEAAGDGEALAEVAADGKVRHGCNSYYILLRFGHS
jgi:hypothetical protein